METQNVVGNAKIHVALQDSIYSKIEIIHLRTGTLFFFFFLGNKYIYLQFLPNYKGIMHSGKDAFIFV